MARYKNEHDKKSGWMEDYYNARFHQGKMCCGFTRLEILIGGQ